MSSCVWGNRTVFQGLCRQSLWTGNLPTKGQAYLWGHMEYSKDFPKPLRWGDGSWEKELMLHHYARDGDLRQGRTHYLVLHKNATAPKQLL